MKVRVFICLLLATIVSVTRVSMGGAIAEPGWIEGDPKVVRADAPLEQKRCTYEMRKITGVSLRFYKDEEHGPMKRCVYHYDGYDISFYKRDFTTILYEGMDIFELYKIVESGMAISYDNGDMYPVEGFSYEFETALIYTQNTAKVWYYGSCFYDSCELLSLHLPSALAYDIATQTYSLMDTTPGKVSYKSGTPSRVLGAQSSANGKWISFVIKGLGLFRFNTDIERADYVASGSTFLGGKNVTAISNDGEYVFTTNSWPTLMVRVSESCASPMPDSWNGSYTDSSLPSCAIRSMSTVNEALASKVNGFTNVVSAFLSSTGSVITIHNMVDGEDSWYYVYPYNTQFDSKMTYLALGDSYSSGEGDISANGDSHYLPNTNILGSYKDSVPRELCHVSDRSYPFLLARDMGVGRGAEMQSVACSGALRNDISINNQTDAYLGQNVQIADNVNRPRLQGLSNLQVMQTDAISKFIPGRVRQVALLKEYKPKVATIGISGNDLGFSQILSGCVLNVGKKCYYVTPEGKEELGNAIQGNYDAQVELFKALKDASPGTDLYAIGYPQFVTTTDNGVCFANMNSLDQDERQMIQEAVAFTNTTIRNAASAAGIKFIDIENSLVGNKMCEGSEAVTTPVRKFVFGAVTDMYKFEDAIRYNSTSPLQDEVLKLANSYYRESSESLSMSINPLTAINIAMQEAFHPNSVGHQLIYNHINNNQQGNSLLDGLCDNSVIYCPSPAVAHVPEKPSYFAGRQAKVKYKSLLSHVDTQGVDFSIGLGMTVQQGGAYRVNLEEAAGAAPGSKVVVSIRSTPITLGEFTSSELGGITGEVVIPLDTPVGYHTLSANSIGLDGTERQFIHPVFVVGRADNDIDGDGIEDALDTCQFVNPSGFDMDGDGVDGACDIQDNRPVAIEDNSGIGVATIERDVHMVGSSAQEWANYVVAQASPLNPSSGLAEAKGELGVVRVSGSKKSDTLKQGSAWYDNLALIGLMILVIAAGMGGYIVSQKNKPL